MSNHAIRKRLGFFSTALCLFLSVAFLPFALLAQNPRGTLRGVVQDASGGRVPAAKIVVQAAGSSLRREASGASRGEFRLDDLLPGTYRLRVEALGFAVASADVDVVVSSVSEIIVTMKPPSMQQTVNVKVAASAIPRQSIDTA